MEALRISHNRHSASKLTRRFTPTDLPQGDSIIDHSYGRSTFHNVALAMVPKHKKTKNFLRKVGEYTVALILSVVASIIAWRIIQWLRRRGGGGGGDGASSDDIEKKSNITGREAYERTEEAPHEADPHDIRIPRAVRSEKVKEVTFVRTLPCGMLPQVKRALLEGYQELEWGTLIARIMDARFEGNYQRRTREAERHLQNAFGIGLYDLLARKPMRTEYPLPSWFPREGRLYDWTTGVLEYVGWRKRRTPLNGFDIHRIMSRNTVGGIGFSNNRSLQVALLWALKETRIAFQAESTGDASDDFIALASTFSGTQFLQREGPSPMGNLISRVNFQLRNGCRFIHEHALASHLARHINDRWGDSQFPFLLTDMLHDKNPLDLAHDLESHDFSGFKDGSEKGEVQFITSLQKLVAAKLKYNAIIAGAYGLLEPRSILKDARANAIDAFQRATNTERNLKIYKAYIRDVAKDIGIALDSLRYPDDDGSNGSATPAGDEESEPSGASHDENSYDGDQTMRPTATTPAPLAYMGLMPTMTGARLLTPG